MGPPIRPLDIGFAVAGIVASAIALVLGNGTVLAAGGTLLLLGTSSFVVIGSLETFTGAAIGADTEIDQDTGWLIGKLENVLVVVLVLVGEWTALSIVFAAKSFVRREDISSGNTTYYLAGTLVNFTYAVVVALALGSLL